MHTRQDSMWAPYDPRVLNWHTYIHVIGSTIFPLPAAPCVVPAWLDVGEMEHPHGACDTAALSVSPSGREQRRLTGPLHINWNRCSDREALFFFTGSSGNHKANILLEDGFRGALWANWEGKWINKQPLGTVNQQAKRRAECTAEAPGVQPKARASVSHRLVLMSKPAGPGSTSL